MRLTLLFYLYKKLFGEIIEVYKNFRNFRLKLTISGFEKVGNESEKIYSPSLQKFSIQMSHLVGGERN